MRTLLNIIWFLFAGLWLGLGYLFAGVLAIFPVVTIPCSVAAFRMAHYVFWPFGKAVVPMERAGAVSGVANMIWFVLCGWWLALLHIGAALACTLTVVGILNAVVSLKMIPVCCVPFGKKIVDRARLAPQERPLHSI